MFINLYLYTINTNQIKLEIKRNLELILYKNKKD